MTHKLSKCLKVKHEDSENFAYVLVTWGRFILANLICFKLNP